MTCRPTYSSSQKHHPAKPDFFLFALGFGLAVALAGPSLSRGTSDALSPMWSLLAATLVGTVCTPLLVAGTSLGTAGVAVSALVAQLAALTVLIWRWHRDGNPLAPGAG